MRRVHLIVLAALLAAGLFAPRASYAQSERCFAETGACVSGRFLQYWDQNGGLPVFGYPTGAAFNAEDPETGTTFLVQFFERNVFELHPENQAPYDVLLGRLGDELLLLNGVDWQALPPESGPKNGCVWFEQTSHNVCNQGANVGFRQYWESHGLEFDGRPGKSYQESLALFGLPLTDVAMETNASGDNVFTQWFERARFEWHPNNPAPHQVLLGLLGNEWLATPDEPTEPEPQPQPAPQPADLCANIAAPRLAIVEPNCVNYGAEFYIEVYGFEPNEPIGYWITHSSGESVGTRTTVRVDEEGRFGGYLDTTDFLPPGDYVFVAQDADQSREPSIAPFRVIP